MPRALGLVLLAGFALAAGVRVYPTSPPVREARPGELVTHVFRVEGEGGPYPVEVHSSAGFPVLSRPGPVRPPRYLPVTERVPEDAREGTLDLLTVRVGGASARVRTRVAFRPGVALAVPERVVFVPPLKLVQVRVRNLGNGPDAFLLRLLAGDEVLELHRLELGPGEEGTRTLGLSRPGAYRVEVLEVRAGLRKTKTLVAERPRRGPLAPFQLVGQAALGYAWPSNGAAASFSLAGALSDYLSLKAYGVFSRPGTALVSLDLTGEGWSAGFDASGTALSGRFSVRLSLWEQSTRVRFAAGSDGPWARAELAFAGHRSCHSWTVSASPGLRLDLTGSGNPTPRWDYGYAFSLAAGGASGSLTLGLRQGSRGYTLGYAGTYSGGEPYRSRISLGLSDTWGSAGAYAALENAALSDWSLAAAATTAALFGPRAPPGSLGLEANPAHLAFSGEARLWPAPELDLGLDAAYRWRGTALAELELGLDLPPPFGSLSAGARLDAGRFSTYLEADAEPPFEEGRLSLSGRLAYPWEGSRLAARVRFGGSARYLELTADGRPFVPLLNLGLSAQTPVGSGVLTASATARYPDGAYAFSLGAKVPLLLPVPEDVAEFFGGRKVATVLGELRPDAPVGSLAGIKVAAGPFEATSDESGRFVLKLPPGKWTLRLVEATLPVELIPERTEVELALREKETVRVVFPLSVRGRIQGRVEVKVEEGRTPPKTRFAVEVADARGRSVALYTDPDGRFDLPGLRPGVYAVRLMTELLPPGYKALIDRVEVRLAPGETAHVTLVVQAPPRKVYKPGKVQILEVSPEVSAAPPGAAPLVTARIKGRPERVLVRYRDRLLGLLFPAGEADLWRGRVAVPEDARGPLQLFLVAEGGGAELARFPFFLAADPRAPWGVVRTYPLVRPGQKGVPVQVHLFAVAEAVELELAGRTFPLKGQGADWQGTFDVPEDVQGRLALRVEARLASGREVTLSRYVLVR